MYAVKCLKIMPAVIISISLSGSKSKYINYTYILKINYGTLHSHPYAIHSITG